MAPRGDFVPNSDSFSNCWPQFCSTRLNTLAAMTLAAANQAVLFVFDKNSTHNADIRGELEAAAAPTAVEAVEVQGTIPRIFFILP